jgi:Spy/CpxP family protein refolding chaperone
MNKYLGRWMAAAVTLVLAAMVVEPVLAQGGGGGGRGGMMRQRAYSQARLATLSEVATDLKLTDEQKTKISAIADQLQSDIRSSFGGGGGPPDMDKLEQMNQDATAKVDALLDAGQQKRLSEITIQVNGASSLNDPAIRKQLNFTDEQTKKYEEARDANRAAMGEVMQMSREERQAKMADLRKEADDRLLGVLTDQQKTEFEAMKGTPLTIDLSALRPRGGGGGGRQNN